jgi:hypothetical protein
MFQNEKSNNGRFVNRPYEIENVAISFDFGDFITCAQDDSSGCGVILAPAMQHLANTTRPSKLLPINI